MPRRLYVDTDPAFTQIWAEVYKCDMHFDTHDILQDTGWTYFYPHGGGLLAFHDEASAVAALETVAQDPMRHARAARAIAEKHCAAPVVINELLETIDCAS
jgi:hypothetical protein